MKIKETLLEMSRSVGRGLKKAFLFLHKNPYLIIIICGFLLNFVGEALGRHSVKASAMHIIENPIAFLYNVLIVITLLSFSLLFKKRYFALTVIGTIILGFAIANCLVVADRTAPLKWPDLFVVKWTILRVYLNAFEIFLIIALILALLTAFVFFFIKCPKNKVNYLKNGIFSGICILVLLGSLFPLRSKGLLMSNHVKDLTTAYKNYGFNYCFLCSMFDVGVYKPQQYSQATVENIVSNLDTAATNNTEVNDAKNYFKNDGQPNVIFVQLESFFDVHRLQNVTFSEDPIPTYSKLLEECSSGKLTVPVFGAGTANTEFEVLTGMSLEYFGVGEYPYNTVLKNGTTESICYNLASLGYKSHAIHNNSANFYSRDRAFSHLGFDTFTSIEYMSNVKYGQNGWAKDSVLTDCVIDALDSSKGADFVYTISVQGHGAYPSDSADDLLIDAEGFCTNPTVAASFEYYVNQLYETDKFISELLAEIEARNEKTVVVLFGDHLPSFDYSYAQLDGGIYETEYIIWDNFGLDSESKDLDSFRLAAEVLGEIGCDNGVMTKLHQNFSSHSEYGEWTNIMLYDMLYGENYAHKNDSVSYKATELELGIKQPVITNVEEFNGSFRISGENFTPFSTVCVENKKLETAYVDSNTLEIRNVELNFDEHISVAQVDERSNVLSRSKYYTLSQKGGKLSVTVDENYQGKTPISGIVTAVIVVAVLTVMIASVAVIIAVKRKKSTSKQNDNS